MIFAHGETPHETNRMQEMMRDMMGDGPMQFMGPFWIVGSLLLFGLVALSILALLRYLSKGTKSAAKNSVEDRYAKGEIDRDEYLRIKKDLGDQK